MLAYNHHIVFKSETESYFRISGLLKGDIRGLSNLLLLLFCACRSRGCKIVRMRLFRGRIDERSVIERNGGERGEGGPPSSKTLRMSTGSSSTVGW